MIDERELREMLERRASTISATPTNAPEAIRRARRRIALNAAVGTLVGLVVLAGVLAGVRIIQAAPTPADEPTPARLGSLAYALDGDIFVAEWDGSNSVKIADGRPPDEWEDGVLVEEHCGPGEYFADGPIWSPDGRYLAYRHTDCNAPAFQADVVISDAEGNVVTSFPSEGPGIAWSPDSTRVAVWDHWGEERSTIGVYGLKGERQTLLTLPVGFGPGDLRPVWSPDGRSLLVGRGEIPLDGSTPRPLPWAPTDPDVAGWALSPDGSRIALAVEMSSCDALRNQGQLSSAMRSRCHGRFVIAEADGSNPQEVSGDWPKMKVAPRWGPVWSPAGDRIAFTPTSPPRGSTQLRVLDVATGTATLLSEVDASKWLRVIEFSPQGDRILFVSVHPDGAGADSLWSVNVDGSDLRRLVTGTSSGDWLSPSPAR
jgi:dipeptidyl aminopeptidase/acylaminoacyl peptidase